MPAASKDKKEKEPYRGPHRDSGWTWLTADGTKLVEGCWYKSKSGRIVYVHMIGKKPRVKHDNREYAHVEVHTTANILYLDEEQVSWFTRTEEPKTPGGTLLIGNDSSDENKQTPTRIAKYDHIYSKYPHVIPGSVYKVKNVSEKVPTWKRKRQGKKKLDIKGQVRCKIKCENCDGERDIKVQDAFQVKLCLECKGKKRKKKLDKFLDKKTSKKKAKKTK